MENRYPTFRLRTKRNRDIADRPDGAYGKLRPTRPGEYLLMDTTRLDVFALDPVTVVSVCVTPGPIVQVAAAEAVVTPRIPPVTMMPAARSG